jgi:hypothetical protein
MGEQLLLVLGIAGLVALLCLFMSMRSLHRQRLLNDTPTSKCQGVFIGLVELKGTAEVNSPCTSHLAEIECVHYGWSIEEHWSRTVTETYRDSKGNTRTRTRHESGWKTVDSGGGQIPFFLQDDTGVVRVLPDGAEIEAMTVFSETCTPLNPLYYGKGPAFAVSNSDHRRRFTETAIPLHAQLYLIGQARERQDAVAAEIAADKHAPIFLISVRREEQVSSGMGWGRWLWLIGGGVALGIGLTVLNTQANDRNAQLPLFLFIGVPAIYLLAALLGWIWTVYNSLITLAQRVRQGWSLIDIQLKRRADLIPALAATVKGLRDYELNCQTELAALRSQAMAGGDGLAGLAGSLRAVVEKYPELTADQGFRELQKQLVDTEERIALAGSYYNDIATFYNTRLEVIPDRFIASLANKQPAQLLHAQAFERSPQSVKF